MSARASSFVAASPSRKTISVRPPGGSVTRFAGRAGIQPGAHRAGERRPALKSRRIVECTVAAEKFRPIRRQCRLSPRQVGEGDVACEFASPRIARQHRAGRRIDLRHDEGGAGASREAEHPFDICGDGETAGLVERFSSVRREILIGSSSGTNCSRSSAIPCEACWNRLYPCPWRPCRATLPPGWAARSGAQSSPVSSSRT